MYYGMQRGKSVYTYRARQHENKSKIDVECWINWIYRNSMAMGNMFNKIVQNHNLRVRFQFNDAVHFPTSSNV